MISNSRLDRIDSETINVSAELEMPDSSAAKRHLSSLGISKSFFIKARQEEITLCHWKSNSHLAEALAGKTDLDILIAKQDQEKVNRLLLDLDFKKMISPPNQRFPGMEDYLGFDEETGELVHLHVHYELIMGQKKVKNHHLPLEQFVFEHLREIDGVPVPQAEVELLLLCLRANLKLSYKDIWRIRLGRRPTFYPLAIVDEFAFLLTDSDRNTFLNVIIKSRLPLNKELLLEFTDSLRNKDLDLSLIKKVRSHIFSALKPCRRYSGILCKWRICVNVLCATRFGRFLFPAKRKTFTEGGKIFALVGADGSGKSTLTKDLSKWLQWKLDVSNLYMGKQRSRKIQLINRCYGLVGLLDKCGLNKFVSKTQKIIRKYYWLFVARERQRISVNSRKQADAGIIVILDRIFLPQFLEMKSPMDGPRIRSENAGKECTLSRKEETCYQSFSMPDKVFVLQTGLDELLRRKPLDCSANVRKQKVEAVNAVKNSEQYLLINGERPYSAVLLEIKQKIWAAL